MGGSRGRNRHGKDGERDDKQTIQDLKSENRYLQKQLKQLAKQLRIAELGEGGAEAYQPPLINESPPVLRLLSCFKCQSKNTSQVTAGVFVFTKCNDCGAKRRNQ